MTPRTAMTRLSTTSTSIGQLAWQTRQKVVVVRSSPVDSCVVDVMRDASGRLRKVVKKIVG
jgi:hypothetical protein